MRGQGVLTVVRIIYLLIAFGFLVPIIVQMISEGWSSLNLLSQAIALLIPISFLIGVVLVPINFETLGRFFGAGGQPPEGFR